MAADLTTDILILGSGGAGLMAALHARWLDADVDITLVTKGMLGKTGCTRMVQGGYNVVLNPTDSLQAHFEDTIRGGFFLNDQELAWTLVEDAPKIVLELENRIGCMFDRAADGQIHQKAFAGQTFDRTVHKGDLTGIEIIARLCDQVFHAGIRCIDETRSLELLTSEGGSRVAGAVLLNMRTGEYVAVRAKAVIMCMGAGPLMYRRSACAQEKSSDGIAMAFRAGARLMDMEMVQFHPTGMVVPGSRLDGALLEEGLRGAGAHLFNGLGERYMSRYDPAKLERSTRDRVSRAAYLEIEEGRGTSNNAVLIDVTHLGAEYIENTFPGMRERCLRIGSDLARERVEVAPTAHFNMGGIRINRDGFTNLEGLFAAGEDSSGVHGANRLGGNGVAESTVYGARVGESAAKWVRTAAHSDVDQAQVSAAQSYAESFLSRKGGENVFKLREELGQLMWTNVGIVRDGTKLRAGLDGIFALRDQLDKVACSGSRMFNLGWQQALDLGNLLTASELIARSALFREDSRGAHFRQDFPQTDNVNWLRNVYCTNSAGGVQLSKEPVAITRLQPLQTAPET